MVVVYRFYEKIERSVSKILGILGNLDYFRHSFFILYQPVITKGVSKDKSDDVEANKRRYPLNFARVGGSPAGWKIDDPPFY